MKNKREIVVNGKKIGHLVDGVFTKRVNSQIHKMRKFPAYGITTATLDELRRMDCQKIVIHETDTGITYTSDLIAWFNDDIRSMTFGGFEKQSFMPLERMKKFEGVKK